jgi:hypothetical protein
MAALLLVGRRLDDSAVRSANKPDADQHFTGEWTERRKAFSLNRIRGGPMSAWVTITMRADIDGGMTLYCHCGRKLKERSDDPKGHYCRRHGLQAVIDKVTRLK